MGDIEQSTETPEEETVTETPLAESEIIMEPAPEESPTGDTTTIAEQ